MTTAMTYLSFLRPGHWLPIAALQAAAKAEAREVTQRWDVPQEPTVPPDLRDKEGRLFRLANGHRVTGRMLPEDAQIGFQSAAVPLMLASLPVLTVVAVLAQFVFGNVGLVLPLIALATVVAMISTAAGTGTAIVAGLSGIALPLFGAQSASSLGVIQGLAPTFFNLGVPVLVLAAFVINNRRLRTAAKIAAAVYGLSVVTSLLPDGWNQAFWLVLACALTPAYAYGVWQTWAIRLAKQGIEANLESTGPQASAHIEARKQQATEATKDTAAFLKVGTARGVFTAKMDGFAPDRGLPFGLTVSDLATHLIVMGATGSGKTASVLRPMTMQFLQRQAGGVLILDGKASLAGEFAGMKNYLLIEPGKVDLALLEGLTPEEVVVAFDQVNRGSSKSESGSAQFFRTAAREMLHHSCNFLSALVTTEKTKHGNGSPHREWRWTLNDLMELVETIQAGTKHNQDAIAGAVQQVKDMHPDAQRRSTLYDSLRYIEITLPGMDSETRANIQITVFGWISPVMHHPKLVDWGHVEHGVDPTACLRGGAVGGCLPELEYGHGGALIQALVKQRVFMGLRRRAQNPNWAQSGETPVLIVVDEAQEICGAADLAMLPVARSLGGMALYATQQFENWSVKLGGDTEARAFLANFRSFVCLASSPATMKWAQEKLGTTWSLIFSSRAHGIDFRGAWRAIAESPLADSGHPAHRLFRKLLQRGAGVIRDDRHTDGLVHHGSGKGIDADDRGLTLPAMSSGEWKMQPLFLDAEADYLAEKGVAVCEVMRGGVRRRDIVKLNFLTATEVLAASQSTAETSPPASAIHRTTPRNAAGSAANPPLRTALESEPELSPVSAPDTSDYHATPVNGAVKP